MDSVDTRGYLLENMYGFSVHLYFREWTGWTHQRCPSLSIPTASRDELDSRCAQEDSVVCTVEFLEERKRSLSFSRGLLTLCAHTSDFQWSFQRSVFACRRALFLVCESDSSSSIYVDVDASYHQYTSTASNTHRRFLRPNLPEVIHG
jgi:hypothetical protein